MLLPQLLHKIDVKNARLDFTAQLLASQLVPVRLCAGWVGGRVGVVGGSQTPDVAMIVRRASAKHQHAASIQSGEDITGSIAMFEHDN
jgi:hypothetical protein